LKYKKETDTKLLSGLINKMQGSKEFFINKAVGWILREYSKTDAGWVIDFVKNTPLDNLSKREALKWLNRKNG
jgi:3-methyladenine DNA glycosylase AlkD